MMATLKAGCACFLQTAMHSTELNITKGIEMLCTTLNKIRDCSPCTDGWNKLLKFMNKTKADDEPVSFATIVESNGLDDALWCCRSAPEYDKEWRLFAVWCARQVQHLMTDERSINALDIAERFANDEATQDELNAAWAAAGAAAWAAQKIQFLKIVSA
jgi:hypothetical protein